MLCAFVSHPRIRSRSFPACILQKVLHSLCGSYCHHQIRDRQMSSICVGIKLSRCIGLPLLLLSLSYHTTKNKNKIICSQSTPTQPCIHLLMVFLPKGYIKLSKPQTRVILFCLSINFEWGICPFSQISLPFSLHYVNWVNYLW